MSIYQNFTIACNATRAKQYEGTSILHAIDAMFANTAFAKLCQASRAHDAFALATSCQRIKPAHNFLGVFPELPSLARKPWEIIKANCTSTVNEHVTLNF
jgi:hypothetical protein